MSDKPGTTAAVHLDDAKLQKFFIDNLNRIYCAKHHMVQRFPEIAELAHFSDISLAIMETVDDVKRQIARMDKIYQELGAEVSLAGCGGLTAMVEEAFTSIAEQKDDIALRDMCILFYMQNMESVEVASFQALQIIAGRMDNKEILQLLLENLDEAKEDRSLLMNITSKYVS